MQSTKSKKIKTKKAKPAYTPRPFPRLIAVVAVIAVLIILANQTTRQSGLPNPAAVHCIQQGGQTITMPTPMGQTGYCILPDERVCEAWEFFRTGQCIPPSEAPAALSVAELLANPVYDTPVTVYGDVSMLGELFCPCFMLTSGSETVQVWYNLMTEDDGTQWPAVSVAEIQNGDRVKVTGELKSAGIYRSLNDFWASSLEKLA